jgi:hypothetical protein
MFEYIYIYKKYILFYWFRPNQSLHLLLNDTCLEEKQQIGPINIWFDPNGARTHNLLHLRRECEPLHHWCGLYICDGQYFLYMYIYSNMMFKHIYIYTSHTWCYIIHNIAESGIKHQKSINQSINQISCLHFYQSKFQLGLMVSQIKGVNETQKEQAPIIIFIDWLIFGV